MSSQCQYRSVFLLPDLCKYVYLVTLLFLAQVDKKKQEYETDETDETDDINPKILTYAKLEKY